jgi:hypothetical protein
MGDCHFLLAIGVAQHIPLEALFRVGPVEADAVRIPAPVVRVNMPLHFHDIAWLVLCLNWPLGHHLLPRLG